jgi:MFS family permease
VSSRLHTPRVFYGWYVLAASFLIIFLNAGGRFVIGVMVKPMAAEFGWSRSAISAAIFLNLAIYALSTLVTGRFYDRWGPKWVIVGSTLLFCAGYALMATMQSLWQFFFYYGILAAAGFGGTTVTFFGSLIGNWFEKRRGLAVSLAVAGNCLGQFFLVPAFSSLIDASGWRTTALWIAGLSVGLNLVLTFAVIRGDPENLGLEPFGRHRPRQLTVAEDGSSGRAISTLTGPRDLTLREAMHTRSLWLFTVAMFVCGGGDYLVTTHLVPMVTDYGISNMVAASMLAWVGLLGLAGILLAGPAADAIGNKIPIATTFAIRVVLFLMILGFKGTLPFWIFSLGQGLTLLVTAPLTTTLVATLYGVKHIGFISGFINTIHGLGGGLWVYLGGLIYDQTGDYDLAFLISAGMAGIALTCTLLIRERRHEPAAVSG